MNVWYRVHTSPTLSFRTHRRCEPESSTAEDSQNMFHCRRTGSPGRGSASPEDDSVCAGGRPGGKHRSQQCPASMHFCTISILSLVTIEVPVFTLTGLRLYLASL